MKHFFGFCIGLFLCVMLSTGCSHFMPRPESESSDKSSSSDSNYLMIDDVEDGDDQISVFGGRNGYLYTYVDERGSTIEPSSNNFKPAEGGAAGSEFALRMKGSTAKSGEVYAGIGFSFREPMGPYDASRCKGIAFVAKKSPESSGAIRVKLPDINTDPVGGVCEECYNDFGIGFKVTDEWTRYVVNFSDLKQEQGWGKPNPTNVDSTKLFGMQWQTTVPGVDFDIWIDDIAFVDCGEK